jgi:hypothetical protein
MSDFARQVGALGGRWRSASSFALGMPRGEGTEGNESAMAGVLVAGRGASALTRATRAAFCIAYMHKAARRFSLAR